MRILFTYFILLVSLMVIGGCTISYGGVFAQSESIMIIDKTPDKLTIIVNDVNDDSFIGIIKEVVEGFLNYE